MIHCKYCAHRTSRSPYAKVAIMTAEIYQLLVGDAVQMLTIRLHAPRLYM